MNLNYEEDIMINENLSIKFIQSDTVKNIFINANDKNLLTKSAEAMTFKGLLSIIAFHSNSDHYTYDYNGTVLYSDIIHIDDGLFLQLEDSLEYYDEYVDDIIKDNDEKLQITLYYQALDDLEIATYDLDDHVIDLFLELQDFKSNEIYQHKINFTEQEGIINSL